MSLLRFKLLLCLAGLCACGGTSHPPNEEPDGHAAEAAVLAYQSVYSDYGEDGPSRWIKLNPDYTACVERTWQSPVDLETPRRLSGKVLLAGAVWFGRTRLIDNLTAVVGRRTR